MSMFVSVASFCDPVLPFTLARAVQQARWPEQLHFGVVDQSPAAPGATPAAALPARITRVQIDPVEARGPCWARALAMSLYEDEDWFFQIDSHMEFGPHWDEFLIGQAQSLLAGRPGLAISSYPTAFVFEDGQPVQRSVTAGVLGHVVKPGSVFEADHPVLGFEAHPFDSTVPVRGFHIGAGCLFAPGDFAKRFPYDPHLYFHGEEQAMASRLFSHGWDIFHVPAMPVYHLYNVPGSQPAMRPMHWDAALEARRSRTWWTLEQRSRQRLKAMLEDGADLGVYGLGTVRSLDDYADFCGIDYRRRTLGETAFKGPWQPRG